MIKIFLTTPYTDPDPKVKTDRLDIVNKVVAKLTERGFIVFSPLSHLHAIEETHNLPEGWDQWPQFDLRFVEWADEVHVLTQDGWEESKGVTSIIEKSEEMRKPVYYVTE